MSLEDSQNGERKVTVHPSKSPLSCSVSAFDHTFCAEARRLYPHTRTTPSGSVACSFSALVNASPPAFSCHPITASCPLIRESSILPR